MEKTKKVRSFAIRMTGVSVLILGLAGCNTVHGAGKDVSAVGHDVSRGASATQQGISNATGASTH